MFFLKLSFRLVIRSVFRDVLFEIHLIWSRNWLFFSSDVWHNGKATWSRCGCISRRCHIHSRIKEFICAEIHWKVGTEQRENQVARWVETTWIKCKTSVQFNVVEASGGSVPSFELIEVLSNSDEWQMRLANRHELAKHAALSAAVFRGQF